MIEKMGGDIDRKRSEMEEVSAAIREHRKKKKYEREDEREKKDKKLGTLRTKLLKLVAEVHALERTLDEYKKFNEEMKSRAKSTRAHFRRSEVFEEAMMATLAGERG